MVTSFGISDLVWFNHKGPIISEDICDIFQLPKKYSVFLFLACWLLSFEFSHTFLESVSKSWGFQLSPRGLNSDFQWIWQMICLICWWNYQKCTHFVVIHNNTFSNFKFRIVQDRNLEYFLGDMKNDLHFLKESHLYPGLGKSGINWNSNGDILNDTNFRRSRRQFHHVGAEYNEEAKTARQTAQVPSTNQHSYCITNSTGGKCLLCLPSN